MKFFRGATTNNIDQAKRKRTVLERGVLFEHTLKALLGLLLYLPNLFFSVAIFPPAHVGQGKDEEAE
ncbi:MAG TPA: hypothetical protein VMF66_09200 [Candidatus Acidoferrum sp.]|nr:hypothetical protein [Candidatus Acidoferrum sp.]